LNVYISIHTFAKFYFRMANNEIATM